MTAQINKCTVARMTRNKSRRSAKFVGHGFGSRQLGRRTQKGKSCPLLVESGTTHMYVCMYVCMYGWMDVWMYVWMYGCMDVWMYGWMDGWMYGCMDVCMDVCKYVGTKGGCSLLFQKKKKDH